MRSTSHQQLNFKKSTAASPDMHFPLKMIDSSISIKLNVEKLTGLASYSEESNSQYSPIAGGKAISISRKPDSSMEKLRKSEEKIQKS